MPRRRRRHRRSSSPSCWPWPMPCPQVASARPSAPRPSARAWCSPSTQASQPCSSSASSAPSRSSPCRLSAPWPPWLSYRSTSYRRSAAYASWSSPRLPPRLASHDGRRIDCLFELLPFEVQHLELSLQVVDIGLFRVTRPDADESLKVDEALLHLLLAQAQQADAQRLPVRFGVWPHAACPRRRQQAPGQVRARRIQSGYEALEIGLRVGRCDRLGPCRCERVRRLVPEGEPLPRRLLGCQPGVQEE